MPDLNWAIGRRRHLAKRAASDSGMPSGGAEGTREEANRLMEYRSFGILADEGDAVAYYRGEKDRPDIIVIVRFDNGKVAEVKTGWPDKREGRKPRVGSGFEELYSVAQAYGD